jgi:nitrogen regulatory protein P-II 1
MLSLVTAIIKPHALEGVKDALKTAGVEGLTITEVKGFGRQAGHTETYRGAEYTIDFVPKVRIEVLAEEADIDQITTAVIGAARTDKIGDGKIWVTNVERVIRIRTGELDGDAI